MRKLNKGVKIAIFAPMIIIAIVIVAMMVKNVLVNVDIASPTATIMMIVIFGAVGFTIGALVVALSGGTAVTPDKAHAAEVAKLEARIKDLESGAKVDEIATVTANKVLDKVEKTMNAATSDADKVAAIDSLLKTKKVRKEAVAKAVKKAKKDVA